MIFDTHLHTKFSSDSEMQLSDALQAADKLGLGLTVTEHYDYDYVICKQYNGGDKDFRFDPKAYWKEYAGHRGENLRLGVELSMSDYSREANEEFIGQIPFDFVIGSMHMLDNNDLYYPDFYAGKSKEEAYGRYLRLMDEQIRKNPYVDALGHIDYVCRYAPFEDKELDYAALHEAIDKVIYALLDTDTVMEINTRRLGNAKAVQGVLPIYRRYKELGGRYVTLGSDAHVAENIGMNFTVALEMVKELELTPVTFDERKMKMCEH